jgi:hypothetical protein
MAACYGTTNCQEELQLPAMLGRAYTAVVPYMPTDTASLRAQPVRNKCAGVPVLSRAARGMVTSRSRQPGADRCGVLITG